MLSFWKSYCYYFLYIFRLFLRKIKLFLPLQGMGGLFTNMFLGVDGTRQQQWSGTWEYTSHAVFSADETKRSSPRTACHICGSTVSRANLRRHIRTHTGEKLYGCSYCTYRTGDRSNLRRHHTSIHPDQPSLGM